MPTTSLDADLLAPRLTEICEWMRARLTERATDLHVPALLEGHRLLKALEGLAPSFAAPRARNEEAVFKLLSLNEKVLLARRGGSEQLHAWLAAERRLSISSALLELAPVVRVHALRTAARSDDDLRWKLLLIAANARDVRDTLELELRDLLDAQARNVASRALTPLRFPNHAHSTTPNLEAP